MFSSSADPISTKMLRIHDVDKYIINIRLAMYTGFYQMVCPESLTIFGRNVYHVCAIVYLGFIAMLLTMIPAGFYYWKNSLSQIVFGLIILGNYLFSCCKVVTIIRNSKQIWEYTEITRIDYMTSYKKYNYDILNKCMVLSTRITCIHSIFCYTLLILWFLLPTLFNDTYMKIKQWDGTYMNYRLNVHNLYMPGVSAETYNEYFSYFYVLEVVFGVCYILFTVLFDNFIVSMCLAISSQIDTINHAFSSVGHEFQNISKNGTRACVTLILLKLQFNIICINH